MQNFVSPKADLAVADSRRGLGRPPVMPHGHHLVPLLLALLIIISLLSPSPSDAAELRADNLKCEYLPEPLGIDTPQPRLSWVLQAKQRGETQAAYQVLVSSSAAQLARDHGDLWDSGKVDSSASIQIAYAGKPLTSGQRAWWKVRVWDANGKRSRFSEPASFEMGLLSPSDWKARWIQRASPDQLPEARAYDDAPAPLLRKSFAVDKQVRRARAYASGLGYYELRLNGERVGDHVLDPGWTTYSKRVFYSVYDVTKQLQRGENALGVMLGSGWFRPMPLALWGSIRPDKVLTTGEPRTIVQLVVEYADGTTQTVVTDDTWRATGGPILRNSVYLGEVYDARREQAGWDKPGFDDSAWERAVPASEPQVGPLCAQISPPIRITRTLKPVKLTEPKPGVFIFDFGQNFAGWSRLKVAGPAGSRVRLRSGELLYPDGTLNGMTAVVGQIKGGGKDYVYDGVGQPKTAFQLDEYVLKGQGTELYTPRFMFHGFRYVEVTGFPGKPTMETLEGLRLNSDVPSAGSFECSNQMFNRIQDMVLWTELSNLFSVQSDCPHREKFGYGGDIAASSEMGMLNFDMTGFYRKASTDLIDAARQNGAFTETAPFVGIADQSLGDGPTTVNLGPGAGPVDWSLAQPLLLVQLRQYYGEHRLIEEQYDATKRWITLLRANAVNGIFDHGISDHESLVPKPRALTGTAAYYYNVKLFAQIARAFGKSADAQDAEAAAEEIRAAFNRKFLQPGTGRYDTAAQVCQAIALHHDLAPAEDQSRVLDVLLKDIEAHQGHLTTGIFGTKYMLNALTDAGRADVAYQIVNQRTFPGWGHMLESGATTLWEHWEFSDNTFSHNHPMFGSVSEWFYKAIAGIQPAPDAVGFDKIVIRPQPVGDLQWAKASYNSVRGKVATEWTREKGGFQLTVNIPVGATAQVHVAARSPDLVTERGRPVASAAGVKFLRMDRGAAVFAVTSGDYTFATATK